VPEPPEAEGRRWNDTEMVFEDDEDEPVETGLTEDFELIEDEDEEPEEPADPGDRSSVRRLFGRSGPRPH
jgi:hypothetical protein